MSMNFVRVANIIICVLLLEEEAIVEYRHFVGKSLKQNKKAQIRITR